MMDHKRPGIFLDRDGVINRLRLDYVKSWDEFEFFPGVLQAIRRLARTEYPIVVITNQSAIGRGVTTQENVQDIHRHMEEAKNVAGGRLDGIYYCPHVPELRCDCRKPRPGLVLQAAKDLKLDLGASWIIGDNHCDIEVAREVGAHSVLVRTGHGHNVIKEMELVQTLIFEDLLQMVEVTYGRLSEEKKGLTLGIL